MKETRTLEYKEQVTNTFLKTVSAFANYTGGKIIFGIADNGTVCPLHDLKNVCLDIENRINDSISPQPDFSLNANETNGTVELAVKEGRAKPYLYKSKAYKRNDTATIEVDSLEFTRLVLEGKNLKYESLPSRLQELSFGYLEQKFREVLGVEKIDADILKTLSLYSEKDGFNNAACILSDQDSFSGIDIARFGESISIIKNRKVLNQMSALRFFDETIAFFKEFYQYEEIQGSERKTVELIPESAFREAVANAIIHRTWDVNANIRISMFNDRIQVVSPGGLPSGITKAEYLDGKNSVLRNPVLANVFYRLRIVEIFGTGVLRIRECYRKSARKPEFEISDNAIAVTLPLYQVDLSLSDDERAVYNTLSKTIPKSISEITSCLPFGKSKVGEILSTLAEAGFIKITGNGRGTKYSL